MWTVERYPSPEPDQVNAAKSEACTGSSRRPVRRSLPPAGAREHVDEAQVARATSGTSQRVGPDRDSLSVSSTPANEQAVNTATDTALIDETTLVDQLEQPEDDQQQERKGFAPALERAEARRHPPHPQQLTCLRSFAKYTSTLMTTFFDQMSKCPIRLVREGPWTIRNNQSAEPNNRTGTTTRAGFTQQELSRTRAIARATKAVTARCDRTRGQPPPLR